jgi:hypothetical protein
MKGQRATIFARRLAKNLFTLKADQSVGTFLNTLAYCRFVKNSGSAPQQAGKES